MILVLFVIGFKPPAADEKLLFQINLKVRADNQRAKGLYKKFGFVKEGYTTRMLKIGDEYFDGEFWGLML